LIAEFGGFRIPLRVREDQSRLARCITAEKRLVLGTFMSKMNAFVHIFVESAQIDAVVASLQRISNIEEIFHVTGEFDLVTYVSAEDIEEFREVLKNKIMKVSGVRSTVSTVVLHHHGRLESMPLEAVVPA
jgi:DNA-binding Lrp family transcriptional regulator